jgi:omega-hydroxy-beta-dihydromenaquinone-9 sulfotransferase
MSSSPIPADGLSVKFWNPSKGEKHPMPSLSHPPAKPREHRPFRGWSPRFWLGCDTRSWFRIMGKGRFAWDWSHLHIGLCTYCVSFGHTVLKWVQDGLYGKEIEATRIEKPPVFIIGHWRTGTTLLHEQLMLDPRHNSPNTYQVMEPNHFLLTEELTKRYGGFLLPERRPMDNMLAGWDRPQEDEFALCMLGQPSPYLQIVYPNLPPIDAGALDLSGLTPKQLSEWKRVFYRYLQTLTYKDPRRLVLKSPPHSCRIPVLLEMFPDARFVHIVRNPYKVYPSTVNLWKSLYDTQSLQRPNYRGVEDRVYDTFLHLYDRLEAGKRLIPPSRFHELKYEDLIRDPRRELRKLYQHLDLGDFETLEPHLEKYLAETKNYATNKFELDPETRAEITQRWGRVIQHYGYPLDTPSGTTRKLSQAG